MCFGRGWRYSDPWAEITKNKLLPNGTKEAILNVVSQEPKTITQIAEALSLSTPASTLTSGHAAHELLRELLSGRKRIRQSAITNRTFQSSRIKSARNLVRRLHVSRGVSNPVAPADYAPRDTTFANRHC